MAGLADTLAQLVARAQHASVETSGGDLIRVEDFGPNLGRLRMWMHRPDGLRKNAPLVVVLHGCGQSAGRYAAHAGWVELADRFGFALLCPEQVRTNNPNLCFNWFEPDDVARDRGEAGSIAQMTRFALANYDLDPRRVFVTGLSAGGAMTAAMLACYPELFAAGAVVAGLPFGVAADVRQALAAMRHPSGLSADILGDRVRAATAEAPPRWPRISIWHGQADTTVKPEAADALARQWCNVHGLMPGRHEPTGLDRHTQQSWRGRDGTIAVELHRIAGLGHGTPIASAGEDGCGSPAPWVIEAGVSSSLMIARFWGIADGRSKRRRRSGAADRSASGGGPWSTIAGVQDVGETITRTLRSAGLMR